MRTDRLTLTPLGRGHAEAYIRPENERSLRVAEKLGFAERSQGLTRSADPMIVFELRRGT